MTKKAKLNGLLLLAASLLMAVPGWAATIQITTHISGSTTWSNVNTYVLNGFIYVLDGGVLTIQPGTVVKAKPGDQAAASCLIVTRGGKIFANGTRTQPIIFTAEADDVNIPFDLPLYTRGLWGGVVILGKAVLNTSVDVNGGAANPKYDVFEALQDSEVSGQRVHRFGGNDDNDSSGVMRYVSIRHAGVVFTTARELNGLSLGAVGRGTVIEYVETFCTRDDGFEFFGGTVNTKYLVSAFNDDDAFDTDQGYRGTNQFWFAIQEPGIKDNGGEWNGEPNGLVKTNNPLSTFQLYNATFIGAGTNTTANRALLIREYSAPKVYNSIFTDFGGVGVTVDVRSVGHLQSGLLDLRDNIWWKFAGNLAGNTDSQVLFTDTSRSNINVDPMLGFISRIDNGRLDPRPVPGSPASHSHRTAPANGFLTPVSYKGAFDTNDLWLDRWTALSQLGIIPGRGANVVQVTASISGTVNWYRTNTYVLNGFIYVLDGGVLNAEAGTVIKAKPGDQAAASCLIVTRGGKIFANGTHNNPIIFTAEADDVNIPFDLPLYTRGLWGGVVILGKAVLNTSVDVNGDAANPKYDVFEALQDSEVSGQRVHRFGGNDDNDSSGVMRYVSIRHAGVVFTTARELNGLSLGAVGRGTTLEFIETFCTRDDGFEFFGGTVDTKYLVSAFNDDDAFDTDQGYRGKNQFWFAIQEPGIKDNGGEWNGEPNGLVKTNTPLSTFQLYNATFIGAGTNTTANRALLIREYSAPKVYNSIFTDFGGVGVTVDVRSVGHLQSGLLDLRDNIWWKFAGNLAGNTDSQILFTDTSRSNINVDPMLGFILRIDDGRLDPRPQSTSPALGRARPVPSGYDPVDYTGAFKSVNWATHWTALGELGIITTVGATAPVPVGDGGVPPCADDNDLSIARGSGDVTISWTSQSSKTYQIQSKASLTDAWVDDGSAIPGTGGTVSRTFSSTAGNKFYRVVCN